MGRISYSMLVNPWSYNVERETAIKTSKNKLDAEMFLQLESHKKKHDRVSLKILYKTIYSNKTFTSLKCC